MANLAYDPVIRESTIRRTGLFLLANNLLSFGSSEELAKSNQMPRILLAAMHELSLDFPSIQPFQVRLPLWFLFLATISPN